MYIHVYVRICFTFNTLQTYETNGPCIYTCTGMQICLCVELSCSLCLLYPRSYVGRPNLTEVYLVGVGDALSTHSAAEAKGIKAHFRMDESGLLLLDSVESLFEYPPDEEEQSTFASEYIHVQDLTILKKNTVT